MLQRVLVLQDRSFQIGWLSGINENLYRFPLADGRSCYMRLSDFANIDYISSAEYIDHSSDEMKPSSTQCIVTTVDLYGCEIELQFDCTPDQFVALLKFYREVNQVADLTNQVFGL